MKILESNSTFNNHPENWPIVRSVVAIPLLVSAAFLGTSAEAQAACVTEPSAWIINSTLECDNPFGTDLLVGADVRVVDSTLDSGSRIGERSQVLASQLSNTAVGADSQVVGATSGSLELPVQIGAGAIIDPGVRISGATIGDNVRLGNSARVAGGRGIDQVFWGDNVTLEPDAVVRIRQLGNNAVIGAGADIGESTEAGNNLLFGAGSVWVVGGEMGNNVTIHENVRIEGGVSIADGARVGANTRLDFRVSIGSSTNIFRDVTVGNTSIVGANALIGRGVVLGTGVTVGDGVLVRRQVQIGDNAMVGAGSIVDVGAVIPVGASIPPESFVASDGTVSPR